MERWVKVVLGTLFGSLAAFVFYLIFERVMQYRRRVRQRESETAHRAGEVSMRVKVKLGRENLVSEEQRNAEMERLVYEEYETDKHEVLAISLETDTVAVGICCFLSDREIEFYWEKFPECCVKNRDGDDHVARNMMAAVSHWATKWTLAEAVNFLVRSRDLVVLVSKGTTRQWRQIAQYEKRHSFNFFIQWAENFICDEVAGEELWEEVVAAARMLANSTEAEVISFSRPGRNLRLSGGWKTFELALHINTQDSTLCNCLLSTFLSTLFHHITIRWMMFGRTSQWHTGGESE